MGNIDHLTWFLGNPIYMFFGSIVMTLAWQSSSLSTTAIIALVASGVLPLPAAVAAVLAVAVAVVGAAPRSPPVVAGALLVLAPAVTRFSG